MMTDEQTSKVLELKARIAATAAKPTGTPKEVRVEVVALKKDLRRHGTTARELAAGLEIHETTLCRWERESRTTERKSTGTKSQRASRAHASRFRVVQLAAAEMTPARSASSQASAAPSRGLRVAHAPSGLVVDGLDVETLAALLRRMS
jgi:hypothetical protein